MKPFPRNLAAILVFAAASLSNAQQGDRGNEVQNPVSPDIIVPPAPPLSVADEMKTFKLQPGFHMEIVASEPLVHDPVVIQFAPDGRLWVVEMAGFMPNVDGIGEDQPVGKIVVLEDTDHDGRMDKRTVFLDKLVMPRALSLIDGGALVAAPTNLWYYRDTDGDGVADQKTDIASDYGNTSGPEHNANGLMWALDNWIYSANHTVRYRYEGNGKFRSDTTISRGQWGITQDDTGRLYYNSNSDPIRVDLLPAAYLRRNPAFQAGGSNAYLAPTTLPVWPNRVTTGINRGYNTLNAEGKEYAVTSACAPVVYRGTLFPAEYRGNVFICEPTGNLVKRIILDEKDGGMTARNAYQGTEFLTSTDERFRPVNLINGPDGALYLVDMYHGIIQHRVFVTTFLRNEILSRNLESATDLGRIYRIVPDGAPRPATTPNLARATPAELVRLLGDASGWTRDTAQRLLVEKRDASVAPALRDFAGSSTNPLGRIHALWTLEGLGSVDRDTALKALADSDPRVVAAAIRVSENLFTASQAQAPDVLTRATALASSSEPSVRLQLALSLGEAKTPAADAALRQLALAAPNQPFLNDAIVSSIGGREEQFVAALADDAKNAATPPSAIVALATGAVLRSNSAARIDVLLDAALADTSPAWARTAVLDGLQALSPQAGRGGRGAGAGAAGPGRAGAAGGRGAAAAGTTAAVAGAAAPAAGGGRGGRGGAAAAGGSLPAEPKALILLASRKNNPDSARAATLLDSLRWPGKPGVETVVATPLTPGEQQLFDKGQAQFATLCATCHQPTGQGLAGIAPPLVNSSWVLGDDRILARIVLAGKTQQNLVMPPMRDLFDDTAIAGLLTYIRRSWGHGAAPVSPAVVAEARAGVAGQKEPWTDAGLDQLVQEMAAQPVRGRGATP